METPDGKHIYEGTNGDTTYHTIWDEDNDTVIFKSKRYLKQSYTRCTVEDHIITIVDQTGKGIDNLQNRE